MLSEGIKSESTVHQFENQAIIDISNDFQTGELGSQALREREESANVAYVRRAGATPHGYRAELPELARLYVNSVA